MSIYIIYILITFIGYYLTIGNRSEYPLNAEKLQRKKLYYTIFAGFLLFLIVALRSVSVGSDTFNYMEHYIYDSKPEFSFKIIAGQELAYQYLEYLFRSLGLPWQIFLAFISAIIIYPMCKLFYKFSPNIWASFFLYSTIGLLSVNMSSLRQSIAISMVTIALIKLFDRKFIEFIIFVFIGYLFHYSALYVFIFGFIYLYKYKSKMQLTIFLFLPLLARIFGILFFTSLASYMPDRYIGNYDSDFIMNPILELIWISILLFCYFSLQFNKNVRNIDYSLYLCVVFFVTSVELSYSVYLASRLAFYFQLSIMVSIPLFIQKFKSDITKTIFSLIIYFLCFLSSLMASQGSDTLKISNYSFFWQ